MDNLSEILNKLFKKTCQDCCFFPQPIHFAVCNVCERKKIWLSIAEPELKEYICKQIK